MVVLITIIFCLQALNMYTFNFKAWDGTIKLTADWTSCQANWVLIFMSICDMICEKGSYSLSKFLSLTDHNLWWVRPITFKVHQLIVLCLGYTVTEFQDGNLITMEVMCCQVHAIRKSITPIFVDPVTYLEWGLSYPNPRGGP